MTGEEWLAQHGDTLRAAGWAEDKLKLVVWRIDERNEEHETARLFWATASYAEKEHALLQDLMYARCHVESPRHNPRACDSCGPIHVALQLLREGKL